MSLAEELDDALSEGTEKVPVTLTPDMVLATAKKVVAADPKKRFALMTVKRQLFKDYGPPGVHPRKIRFVDPGGSDVYYGDMIEKMTGEHFIHARAHGYWKLRKDTSKSKGLSFQKVSRDEVEVLYNKEHIGTIERLFGLIPGRASRESEWTYSWSLDQDALRDELGIVTQLVPGESGLRGLNDCKKQIKAFLKKHGK